MNGPISFNPTLNRPSGTCPVGSSAATWGTAVGAADLGASALAAGAAAFGASALAAGAAASGSGDDVPQAATRSNATNAQSVPKILQGKTPLRFIMILLSYENRCRGTAARVRGKGAFQKVPINQ